MKGGSAPEESADTMGAPNLNPEESPEVEGVLNTSQGSLLEVNPEKGVCIPETETGEISVDAEMASEVLGTPGDKTALESQGISGRLLRPCRSWRLRESKKCRIWMKLCRLMNH